MKCPTCGGCGYVWWSEPSMEIDGDGNPYPVQVQVSAECPECSWGTGGRMMDEADKFSVRSFTKKYGKPVVRSADHIRGVVVIPPIPTICGPEILCHTSQESDVRAVVQEKES